MSAWIKCSERMPEDEVRVLVVCETRTGFGTINICRRWCHAWHSDFGYTPWTFTHWQPLPEPPSEQAAEEKCNR